MQKPNVTALWMKRWFRFLFRRKMVMCVAARDAKMKTNIIDRPRSSVSFGTPPMAAILGGYGGPAAWSDVSKLLRTRGWVTDF